MTLLCPCGRWFPAEWEGAWLPIRCGRCPDNLSQSGGRVRFLSRFRSPLVGQSLNPNMRSPRIDGAEKPSKGASA